MYKQMNKIHIKSVRHVSKYKVFIQLINFKMLIHLPKSNLQNKFLRWKAILIELSIRNNITLNH